MKTPLSLVVAGVIVAGMIPAAFALTTSGSSSSQATAYNSPYGRFYQNGSRASMNSSSSSMSSYNYNYLYGSSSSSYSLMPLSNTYGSSSSYGLPSPAYGGMSAFQGLSCIGMSGQNFLNCLQQYGVVHQPGSLLFNGSGSTMGSFNCDQYMGTQQQLCQQQLLSWWKSYNASLQIWLTQLQTYLQSLMANAGISPTQVGSMMGGNVSSYGYGSSSSVMNEIAIQQAWQLCKQFDFTQQQHCMHDALTDYPRYQDWLKALQLMQEQNNQQSTANQRGIVKSKSNITNNRNVQMNNSSTNMNANTGGNTGFGNGTNSY